MNKVAFLSTVYPGADTYLDDFFKSLVTQDYKHFDVIILNDGLDNFEKYSSLYKTLNIHEIKYTDTPAKIREKGLKYTIENKYDVIIFGDCDDYFKNNRLSESIRCLEAYDVVVNDFDLLSNDNKIITPNYLSNRLNDNQEILLDYVLDKNCFGLSNTAINAKFLRSICFDSNLIAVDWYLFSFLLLRGIRAVFTNNTGTYYRQYEGNAIGISSLDDSKILKGIEAKLIHYREMAKLSDEFLPLYESFYNLRNAISKNNGFKESYLEQIRNREIVSPLWWENIKLLNEGE